MVEFNSTMNELDYYDSQVPVDSSKPISCIVALLKVYVRTQKRKGAVNTHAILPFQQSQRGRTTTPGTECL